MKTKFFQIVPILAMICLLINGCHDAQRAIVNEVRDLKDDCIKIGENDSIRIIGKVLVWDMENNSPSSINDMIPDSLQAGPSDKPITVFMVSGKQKMQVGTYSVTGEHAYREWVDVAIALWPDKKPIGFRSIVSAEPRSSRLVQYSPEYGDPNKPIADWIEKMASPFSIWGKINSKTTRSGLKRVLGVSG